MLQGSGPFVRLDVAVALQLQQTRPNASADGKRGTNGLLMWPTYQHQDYCLACGLGRPASAALELAFFKIRKQWGGALCFECELQTPHRRLEMDLRVLK